MDLNEIQRALDEIVTKVVELREQIADEPDPQFPKMKVKILEAGWCLQCYEDGKRKVKSAQRGLCQKHYHETRRRVLRGETTYRWLISEGLIAPKSSPGRKSVDTVLGRKLREKRGK